MVYPQAMCFRPPVVCHLHKMISPTHCNLNSDLFLFADDTKMFKHILCIDDSDALLKDCQKLFDWCEQWLVSFEHQ